MTRWRDWPRLVDEYLAPPDVEFVVGRCRECGLEVWISTSERPVGMARSCEEHWPLCELGE